MKRILHFLKPYWLLCAATLATVVIDVVGVLLIPTITAEMINVGVSSQDFDTVLRLGLIMLAAAVFTGVAAMIGTWLSSDLSNKVGRDMHNAVYDKSLTFSAADYDRFGTGSMITRTLNDVTVVQQAVSMGLQLVIPVPVMCVLGILFALRINIDMGLLILGAMVLLGVVAALIIRQTSDIFDRLQRLFDRMNVVLREAVSGARIIRAFNKETQEQKRRNTAFSDYASTAIKANRLFAILDSWSLFVVNVIIVAILWIGGNHVGEGVMQIGDITALTEYAILILYYLITAQMVLTLLPRAVVCMKRIGEVLSHEPAIRDEGMVVAGGKPSTTTADPVVQSGEIIRFDNVSFRYEDADEDMLHEISFSCRRGQMTGIIGSTGSGKSTIARLMLRFHDVSRGKILFEGVDIRDMPQHTLRELIAYVPQQAWLASGTIADNLRYGRPDANESEMHHALKISQASFVDELTGTLQATVSQGGGNFSGGQKQRLAIARGLIKKADMYVFDDSFSALDFKTDAALRKALAEEMHDVATVIIAQRINTILHADQIIVLEEGCIVGKGTHAQLMETCEVYRDIAASQMKGGE